MNWASKAFKEQSERLQISAEMGLGAFYTQLNRFWDQMAMRISQDVGDMTLRSIYAAHSAGKAHVQPDGLAECARRIH